MTTPRQAAIDAAERASNAVSVGLLIDVIRLQNSLRPLRAEEQLIVVLNAICSTTERLGLTGAHIDYLRDGLNEQIVSLSDAVAEFDSATDFEQFGEAA